MRHNMQPEHNPGFTPKEKAISGAAAIVGGLIFAAGVAAVNTAAEIAYPELRTYGGYALQAIGAITAIAGGGALFLGEHQS